MSRALTPYSKILLLLISIVVALCSSGISSIATLIMLLSLMWLYRVGFKALFLSLRGTIPFLIFMVLLNFSFTESTDPYFSFWFFTPSREGLFAGLRLVVRFLLVVMATVIYREGATINETAEGIDFLLTPLTLLGLPTAILSEIMNMTLRFIPIIKEESEALLRAQRARGVRFSSSLLRKAEAVMPLVIPIFISALRRCDELALALEARGYDPKRVKPHSPITFTSLDVIALLYGLICSLVIITLAIIF